MASNREYKGAIKVNLSFISTEEPSPAYNEYWGDFVDAKLRRQILKRPRKYDIYVYVRIKPEFWHKHWQEYPQLTGKAVGFLHPITSDGVISRENLDIKIQQYTSSALRQEVYNHIDLYKSYFVASVGYDEEYIERRLKLCEK